ncbi:LAME_0H15852g1_1 [Lachancea meyersii CBS 8951]|uniref:Chromatin modification-related protein EAF3 n=1 Tax=Lachancea meyersii CBS 8951 TaxID=1266667 RepID=A0A1G4KI06_9SACH|nr:LAME_0H15852g1_1 [Lachancea meyersii CBS 8951]
MPLAVEDKCLAFHGPLLYAAKILKVHDPENAEEQTVNDDNDKNNEEGDEDEVPANLKDQECFYIHYRGWKSSWDEWVGLDRIREYTDENLEYKRQLVEQAKDARQAKKKAPSKPRKPVEPRKRKNVPGSAPDETGNPTQPSGPRIVIHISQQLKAVLVDDWERITKDKKLVSLPCKPTAAQLLDEYYETASANEVSPVVQSQLQEYCSGLRLYFDHSIAVILLYRFERLQYADHVEEPASTVYGGIHLLRLLTSLPELISLTSMDEFGCDVVVQETEKLLKWLGERPEIFQESAYVNTSSQYEGMALGM